MGRPGAAGGSLILTELMKGRLSREPRTGTLRIKPTTTGKKPLQEARGEMMMMKKDLALRSETNTAPSPEQEKESVNLQHNANNGPPDQDHTHAPQEETGGFHLVLLEEEAKRPLQSDDKGQSSHKQYLQGREDNELLTGTSQGPGSCSHQR